MEIPMEINDDIVTVRTMPLDLTKEQDEKLGAYIEDAWKQQRRTRIHEDG